MLEPGHRLLQIHVTYEKNVFEKKKKKVAEIIKM